MTSFKVESKLKLQYRFALTSGSSSIKNSCINSPINFPGYNQKYYYSIKGGGDLQYGLLKDPWFKLPPIMNNSNRIEIGGGDNLHHGPLKAFYSQSAPRCYP